MPVEKYMPKKQPKRPYLIFRKSNAIENGMGKKIDKSERLQPQNDGLSERRIVGPGNRWGWGMLFRWSGRGCWHGEPAYIHIPHASCEIYMLPSLKSSLKSDFKGAGQSIHSPAMFIMPSATATWFFQESPSLWVLGKGSRKRLFSHTGGTPEEGGYDTDSWWKRCGSLVPY